MVGPDVEAGDDRAHGTVREVQHAHEVRRCVDRDLCAVLEPACDRAFWEGGLGRAGNASHRSDQRDQRCEIIGAHIEERTPAGLVVEIGIEMPMLWSMIHQKCGGRDGPPDLPIVDKLDACLDTAAQERIGRATYAQPLRVRRVQQHLALLTIDAQWFLAVHRFACLKCRQADLDMYFGDRQVEHDLDLWIDQQFFDCTHLWNGEALSLRSCLLHVDICTCNDVQIIEGRGRLHVDSANLAASDNADIGFPGGRQGYNPLSFASSEQDDPHNRPVSFTYITLYPLLLWFGAKSGAIWRGI